MDEVGLEPGLTLDPVGAEGWAEFRALAHRVLDEALDFTEKVRERPVWQPVPAESALRVAGELPQEGTPLEALCTEVTETILPYATGNVHPRFLGWVHGSGQPGNLLAEMLASAMNANCGGRDHGAIYVERQVLEWCRQLFGFPEGTSGLLVSGTSMGNLIGLAVARNEAVAGMRAAGVGAMRGRLTVYASSEVHDSVAKALELLGLGAEALRRVAVTDAFGMDVTALRERIREDRAAGLQPMCVVGCAGTVNTGAFDGLEELAAVCREEGLWFHVDGAFGGLCRMSEAKRGLVRGIELADSLAFDFHKWMHVQYDAGCVLVRRAGAQYAAFSMRPPYLAHASGGLGGGMEWPCDLGPELSRSFRALKVWFAFRENGVRKFGALIEQNCALAEYLGERVVRETRLELMTPVTLQIVCFRVKWEGASEAELDARNERLLIWLQESGVAAPSSTRIGGRFAIRVNVTNHRTRREDLDVVVGKVLELAGSF